MADGFIAIAHRKSRGAAIDQKGRDPFLGAFVRLVFACGDEDDEEICMICAADEMFAAIDHPIATIALGAAFHAADVRAGARFRHRQSIHALAAHGGHEIAVNLIAFTGHENILWSTKEMIERHRSAPQFTLDQCKIYMRQARASHAFRKIAGIKAQLQRFLFDVLGNFIGHFARAFHQLFMRVNFFFNK